MASELKSREGASTRQQGHSSAATPSKQPHQDPSSSINNANSCPNCANEREPTVSRQTECLGRDHRRRRKIKLAHQGHCSSSSSSSSVSACSTTTTGTFAARSASLATSTSSSLCPFAVSVSACSISSSSSCSSSILSTDCSTGLSEHTSLNSQSEDSEHDDKATTSERQQTRSDNSAPAEPAQVEPETRMASMEMRDWLLLSPVDYVWRSSAGARAHSFTATNSPYLCVPDTDDRRTAGTSDGPMVACSSSRSRSLCTDDELDWRRLSKNGPNGPSPSSGSSWRGNMMDELSRRFGRLKRNTIEKIRQQLNSSQLNLLVEQQKRPCNPSIQLEQPTQPIYACSSAEGNVLLYTAGGVYVGSRERMNQLDDSEDSTNRLSGAIERTQNETAPDIDRGADLCETKTGAAHAHDNDSAARAPLSLDHLISTRCLDETEFNRQLSSSDASRKIDDHQCYSSALEEDSVSNMSIVGRARMSQQPATNQSELIQATDRKRYSCDDDLPTDEPSSMKGKSVADESIRRFRAGDTRNQVLLKESRSHSLSGIDRKEDPVVTIATSRSSRSDFKNFRNSSHELNRIHSRKNKNRNYHYNPNECGFTPAELAKQKYRPATGDRDERAASSRLFDQRRIKLLEYKEANWFNSSCVHCQLISELTSRQPTLTNGPLAFLYQLIELTRSVDYATSNSAASCDQPEHEPIINKPSLVLTVCSNQGTLDEEDIELRDKTNIRKAEPRDFGRESSDHLLDSRCRLISSSSSSSLSSGSDETGESNQRERFVVLENSRFDASEIAKKNSSSISINSSSSSSSSSSTRNWCSLRAAAIAAGKSAQKSDSSDEADQSTDESGRVRLRRSRRRSIKKIGEMRQCQATNEGEEYGFQDEKTDFGCRPTLLELPEPAGCSQSGKQERSKSLDAPTCLLQVPGIPTPSASVEDVATSTDYCSHSLDAKYASSRYSSANLLSVDEHQGGAKSNRSRSVDISLPALPGDPYGVQFGGSTVDEQDREDSLDDSKAVQCRVARARGMHKRVFERSDSSSTFILKLLAGGSGPGERAARQQFGARAKQLGVNSSASVMAIDSVTKLEDIKKFIQGEIKVPCANGETRALKLFVNWDENCVNGEHLWVYMGSSSEACYIGESECLKHGPRLCCSACKIVAHTGCISILIDKIKFICKHTFKDLTVTNPRHLKEIQQQNVIYHHWVHKKTHCGRCKQCTKTIGNTKLPFSSKEILAITCSWCKVSYHNKENCYTLSTLTEPCSLGSHRESIIPPTWILKVQNPSGDESETNEKLYLSGPDDKLVCDQLMSENSTETTNYDNHQPDLMSLESCNDKENRSQFQSNKQQSPQTRCQQRHESNMTVATDTSGFVSTDGLTSISSNNNNTIDYHCGPNRANNSVETNELNRYIGESSARDRCHKRMSVEELRDPPARDVLDETSAADRTSSLHLSDLTSLNQVHSRPTDENLVLGSHANDHQDEGLDQRRNLDQDGKMNEKSTESPIDYQSCRGGFCRNFKIAPHPIQDVPNAGSKPVLVFVNPRSGGNQGVKMMQKFMWLLNPRQVFDLIQSGGPRPAIELYRDVPNLRILTIGGDGTASWILSNLDEVGVSNKIPVAVLPLGTGNDLARALGWGGGYADEPIAKILTQVRDGEIVQLDRWNLNVERNYEVAPGSPSEFSSAGSGANIELVSSNSIASSPSFCGTVSNVSMMDQTNCDTAPVAGTLLGADETGSDRLPMDVINNYFSFGVDAHIALEFHLAREAHPERFNSRLRNRMFYGQAGGKDLLKRKWKDLSNYVTLYCDGQDMTNRLKELKVHSVLFLNIPSYGGGTRPWPTTATSFAKPRTDDGLIEVIGLTTYQLPLLQAGGHGTCIAQCRNAKIVTSRTIPMQVDGEPCKLLPSIINISFKNRVCMLAKTRSSGHSQKIVP